MSDPDASQDAPPAPSPVDLTALRDVVRSLRHPDTGCPWDQVQTHRSLAPHMIEEAFEAVEVLESGTIDDAELRDELGDVLLQVVFHAQLADERDAFNLQAVADTIAAKMVERHPHVFGDATPEEAAAAWESRKRARKGRQGVLDGVPTHLPALQRAQRLSAKAATVGFDWPSVEDVMGKLDEELGELREALESGDTDAFEDELGDVLFTLANVARKRGVHAESALRRTLTKFQRRFAYVEQRLRDQGRAADDPDVDLATLDALWDEARAARVERDTDAT